MGVLEVSRIHNAESYTSRKRQEKIPVLPAFKRESHLPPSHPRSGGALVDPELRDNVVIQLGWKEYLYHVGHSMQAGFIAGGDTKEARHAVFFASLDPGDEPVEEYQDRKDERCNTEESGK